MSLEFFTILFSVICISSAHLKTRKYFEFSLCCQIIHVFPPLTCHVIHILTCKRQCSCNLCFKKVLHYESQRVITITLLYIALLIQINIAVMACLSEKKFYFSCSYEENKQGRLGQMRTVHINRAFSHSYKNKIYTYNSCIYIYTYVCITCIYYM